MKYFLRIFFCYAIALAGKAQEVDIQWASYIIYAQSQLDTLQYSAKQALGKPNSAVGKQNFCAWAPNNNRKAANQTLMVGFDNMIRVEQIVINENKYTGLIKSVRVGYMPKSSEPFQDYPTGIPSRKQVYENLKPKAVNSKDFLYINLNTPADSVNFVEIELSNQIGVQIDAVGIATSQKTKPITMKTFDFKDVALERMGNEINSESDEIAPVISNDGKILYFTRNKHPENISEKQDVWSITIKEKNAKPQNLGAPINNVFHNSVFGTFGNDQKLLVNNIYKADSTLERGVSYSIKNGKKWSKPKELKIDDYYNKASYGEYFLTQDENILLMTAERKNTHGGKDIYISFKKDDYSYSEPINLGKTINTAAQETSPFLSSNGKVLFFSTAGHLGFGGNDIFLAYRLDDTWTNWSEPINLGAWINTSDWEAYLSMPAKNDYLYFASYRGNGTNADIFRIKLTEKMNDILMGK